MPLRRLDRRGRSRSRRTSSSPSVPSSAESVTGVAVVERLVDLADVDVGERVLVRTGRDRLHARVEQRGVAGAELRRSSAVRRSRCRCTSCATAEHGLAGGGGRSDVDGPALSTSTVPTFSTEVLTVEHLRSWWSVVDSACRLGLPAARARGEREREGERRARARNSSGSGIAQQHGCHLRIRAALASEPEREASRGACGNSSRSSPSRSTSTTANSLVTWCSRARRHTARRSAASTARPDCGRDPLGAHRAARRRRVARSDRAGRTRHGHRGVPRPPQDRRACRPDAGSCSKAS